MRCGPRSRFRQLWDIGPPTTSGATTSDYHHGQREGFVVLGDAACSFNPVYGQGMTTAGLAALVLKQCLHEQRRRLPSGDLTGFAHRFQRCLAKVNKGPWLLATGEDLRYPQVEGTRPGAQPDAVRLNQLEIALFHRFLVNAVTFQRSVMGTRRASSEH